MGLLKARANSARMSAISAPLAAISSSFFRNSAASLASGVDAFGAAPLPLPLSTTAAAEALPFSTGGVPMPGAGGGGVLVYVDAW